jgi:hypothetical protein
MGFTISGIIEFLILISNSLAIVNEKRVLKKYGWEKPNMEQLAD